MRPRSVCLALALLPITLSPIASVARDAPTEARSRPDSASTPIDNPAIDMQAFLRVAAQAASHRQSHRVSEAEFRLMARERGTLTLDARSSAKYDLLHVKGAVNLSFPDMSIESLQRLIPDKSTRILIYCNNNFSGAEKPFPSKLPSASLNLSTYVALYDYGYRNVYELAPLVDLKDSALEFESSPGESD